MRTVTSREYEVTKKGGLRKQNPQLVTEKTLEVEVERSRGGWYNVHIRSDANAYGKQAHTQYGYNATEKRWAYGNAPPLPFLAAAIDEGLPI